LSFFWGGKFRKLAQKWRQNQLDISKTQQFKIQNSVLRKLQAINNSDKTDLNRISSKRT
jgi:hypothetical protein